MIYVVNTLNLRSKLFKKDCTVGHLFFVLLKYLTFILMPLKNFQIDLFSFSWDNYHLQFRPQSNFLLQWKDALGSRLLSLIGKILFPYVIVLPFACYYLFKRYFSVAWTTSIILHALGHFSFFSALLIIFTSSFTFKVWYLFFNITCIPISDVIFPWNLVMSLHHQSFIL